MNRRQALGGIAAGLGAVAAGGAAIAQDVFPSRNIRLIVPLAAGGGTDAVSRLVAQEMGKQLGQAIVVENMAGGGTTIATSTLVRATPDGYTLMTGTPSLAINVGLRHDLRYDTLKDLQPVSLLSRVPYVLIAGPSLKVGSLAELVAMARAKPESVTVGSPGIGSGGHFAAELLQMLAGIKLTHVPYKGAGPAMTDLRGGQIHLLFATTPAATALLEQHAVTALGVSSTRRLSTLATVPTIAEGGVPGYEDFSWYGIFAPAATPRAVVDRLNGAVLAALRSESVARVIRSDGGEPAPSTPEELKAFLAGEVAKWSAVIKKAGIRT